MAPFIRLTYCQMNRTVKNNRYCLVCTFVNVWHKNRNSNDGTGMYIEDVWSSWCPLLLWRRVNTQKVSLLMVVSIYLHRPAHSIRRNSLIYLQRARHDGKSKHVPNCTEMAACVYQLRVYHHQPSVSNMAITCTTDQKYGQILKTNVWLTKAWACLDLLSFKPQQSMGLIVNPTMNHHSGALHKWVCHTSYGAFIWVFCLPARTLVEHCVHPSPMDVKHPIEPCLDNACTHL